MTIPPLGFRSTLAGVLVLLGVAASPAIAHTQESTRIELGMDAMLARTTFGNRNVSASTTTFELPVQAFRMGFQLSPNVSIEPTLGLRSASGNGSGTIFIFDLALPLTLSTQPSGTNFFLRPLLGFRHFSLDDDSNTQTNFGVGLGMRGPVMSRLSTRFEARFRHGLENAPFSSFNEIGLLAGLSFFTR